MRKQTVANQTTLRCFSNYLQDIGRSSTWGWRARKKGWITTVNIAGRVYVTADAVAEFETKVRAGELSKTATTPTRSENSQ